MKHSFYFLKLFIVAVVILFLLLSAKYITDKTSSDDILGQWQSEDTPPMEIVIEENTMTINGLCFAYEKVFPIVPNTTCEEPQSFVLNADSMGILQGSYFVEKKELHLNVGGDEKIFVR